jgi:hypothetical protein
MQSRSSRRENIQAESVASLIGIKSCVKYQSATYVTPRHQAKYYAYEENDVYGLLNKFTIERTADDTGIFGLPHEFGNRVLQTSVHDFREARRGDLR